MSKHEAMVEYLKQYPGLRSFLYFNTATNIVGNISVQTIYSDEWEEQDITGHGTKRYDFAIIFMTPQDSSGTSNLNVAQMDSVQAFMEWIREQDKQKNFPDFGESEVYSIENLQNMPNLSTANESVSKYMFQCRVRYYE